jgi:hypothetical protein
MQQWKQENSFFRDPYDESCNFRSRPRKKLKTVTDWKELSQICSGTGQKIKFLLKNRAAVTKTITFLPSVLRLDDIEDFSEDRNQPLPTTQRPTHKNIHIKNEPSVNQLHVSFAADLRSSPAGTTSHRPLLVKKERTPQKSILKNSNTKTSISNDNTVGKKRKRSDQIMEIYTDSVLDDYDVSDIMYTYSYDDINLHNIQPVYNTNNIEQVQIKEEKIPDTNPNNTLSNNNNTKNNPSDVSHKRHEVHSEMSRVPDSLADVILAKDSQPVTDAPTPSPHLSLALNTAIEEQFLSQKVQLIPSQLSAMNQRSSTSFGTMSHVSDSISHPSAVSHKANNKRVELTYVDSQQSLHEHDHMSVEESELESQSASNNKLLQDSYDDDAEVLNGNLLSLKRKNSLALMLSTKKKKNSTTNTVHKKKDVEVPLSTQQYDVPETMSYHSNNHKESETQKQVVNAAAYTFVSLTNKNNNDNSHNNKSPKKDKPKDVIELSSDSGKNKEKNSKSAAASKDIQYDDSLDDFDVAPRSVKKTKKAITKKTNKNNNSSGSSDSNKTIVIEGKKKNNSKTTSKKKDKKKKKASSSFVQENQNLKLLISQSSDEDKNGSQNNAKSVDLSDFESSYAIYMPSSDDLM